MMIVLLVVRPSKDISMIPKISQVTIIKSIIKKAGRAIVIPSTTMFLTRASDQVKIPKQEPIIMTVSF
jgi:hypothetical protein